jgi:hypothetical protein
MWRTLLGIVGFGLGMALAGTMIQFCPVWLLLLAGLLGASIGLLTGMVIDARAVAWQAVLGLFGLLFGAPLGGMLVWYFGSFRDTFSGGGLAGLFVGLPGGALLGCALGCWLGRRLDRRRSET